VLTEIAGLLKINNWLNDICACETPLIIDTIVSFDRNKLVIGWVRAYAINWDESNRLLVQSSVAGEVFSYLDSTDAPQELIDKLEQGVKVGNSYIIELPIKLELQPVERESLVGCCFRALLHSSAPFVLIPSLGNLVHWIFINLHQR
jgi:hypothetical protein